MLNEILPERYKKIHMVGIGGTGMSGIAEVLHNLGFKVSGSDLKESVYVKRLRSLGIPVKIGHSPENLGDAQVVVYSSAVSENNPEIVEAKKRKIPVIPRAEMLAELMRMKYSIAISGAHGKTTTTSLIGHLLSGANLEPTIVVGGRIKGACTGAIVGKGPYMVVEADESDASFLKLFPTLAVVTNVDREHLNHYGNFIKLKQAFVDFVDKVPFYGAGIINIDDPDTREISDAVTRRVITYGLNGEAMVRGEIKKIEGLKSVTEVFVNKKRVATMKLNIPGLHNIKNALAAFAVGLELDIPIKQIIEILETFKGVVRRFEIKGDRNGIQVIDDYGHHPTEIKAVLDTARNYWKKGRIIVVFQPHRFTRTSLLYKEFGPALEKADLVILMDIYPAGEEPMEGVNSDLLLPYMKTHTVRVKDINEAILKIKELAREGDLVITLGAGDVYKVGEKFLRGE